MHGQPLIIPAEAVLLAGARAITSGPGKEWGLSLKTRLTHGIQDPAPLAERLDNILAKQVKKMIRN
jgi:hypothetical protein